MPRPSLANPPPMLPPQAAPLLSALQLFEQLPQHISQRAVPPMSALSAAEPSLSAVRLRAFDAAGRLCLYRHTYTIAEIDFDSDDVPYVRVSLREVVTAVRTRANTWLQRTQRWTPEASQTGEDSGYRIAPRFVEV